jgi:hypothetical protein
MIRGIEVMPLPMSFCLISGMLSPCKRACPTVPCRLDTVAERFWLLYSDIDSM